jgi:hypothetical protein
MITSVLRQKWRTLLSKGEPSGRGGKQRRTAVRTAVALVGGLAAAQESAEGFQAGGRVMRGRPLVEGAAG